MANKINKLDRPSNTIQLPFLSRVGDVLNWSVGLIEEIRKSVTQTNNRLNTATWQLVQWVDINTAVDTILFSGFDGDTDVEYMIIAKMVQNSICNISLRPNSDSGTNYVLQTLTASGATIGGSIGSGVSSGMRIGMVTSAGDISFSKTLLFAKTKINGTGYYRTAITEGINNGNGTSADLSSYRSIWLNNTDNITSLLVFSDNTGGIGVGSHIEIWTR